MVERSVTNGRPPMGVGYPPEHWRNVAECVANHPERGEVYFSAARVVAEEFKVPRANATYWVRRAREHGYLTMRNELGPTWHVEDQERTNVS